MNELIPLPNVYFRCHSFLNLNYYCILYNHPVYVVYFFINKEADLHNWPIFSDAWKMGRLSSPVAVCAPEFQNIIF